MQAATGQGMAMDHDVSNRPAANWSVGRLAILLYIFAAAAVAINLFMLGLLMQAFGLPAISPTAALLASGPLGVPAAWAAGKWVRHLLDQSA